MDLVSRGSSNPAGGTAVSLIDLRKIFEVEQKKTKCLLLEMRNLIKLMVDSTQKQTNVNKTIKIGLPKLGMALNELMKTCWISLSVRRRLVQRSDMAEARASDPTLKRGG